jgi:hypothetical protein
MPNATTWWITKGNCVDSDRSGTAFLDAAYIMKVEALRAPQPQFCEAVSLAHRAPPYVKTALKTETQ